MRAEGHLEMGRSLRTPTLMTIFSKSMFIYIAQSYQIYLVIHLAKTVWTDLYVSPPSVLNYIAL